MMPTSDIERPAKRGSLRGRESRNQTLSTKLTETEYRNVEKASSGRWQDDRGVASRPYSPQPPQWSERCRTHRTVGDRRRSPPPRERPSFARNRTAHDGRGVRQVGK